ncbi:hypothetical protein FHR81_002265 [Actinoalloteichus hoggarensis]|uniref:Uncharacterized protein n=1 Tax=Actinoalloteichus hoggarensis TaxID=1470176 RepID=A0A221W600_9PSEU|nr:hypothetical protein [Actinoalloteichus hoggarensis]ASO21295.1 hypothetical protein AHOG_18350 [Actinoalloteichus hoggarensis]MBB5921227.1 hypothetical protein [Actinoalloteichus hoggarensis]
MDAEEPNLRLFGDAAVLTRSRSPEAAGRRGDDSAAEAAEAEAWLAEALRRNPGARLAATAVADGTRLRLRDGRRLWITDDEDEPDPRLAASAAYAALVERILGDGGLIVRVGAVERLLTVRIVEAG